jgi:hypothetical protein
MEPLKIQIEVSLSEATITGLKDLMVSATLPALLRAVPPGAVHDMAEAMKQAVSSAQAEQSPTPAVKAAETTQNAPKKEAEAPVPAEIPDLTLFEAVKAAQKERKVAPATVRKVFAEFGIETSSQCPQERRAELLQRISLLGVEGNAS